MASDLKISQLPLATALTGSETMAGLQAGNDVQISVAQMLSKVYATTELIAIFGFVMPTWFGADPTGTHDSAPALLQAFNTLPNITSISSSGGGLIVFPAGLFRFNSQVVLPLPIGWATVSIRGAGGAATVLWWPNASGGIVIDMSANSPFSSATIESMKLITGQSSGGSGITLLNSGAPVSQLQGQSVMRDLMFWGDDSSTHYWTNSISVVNVCNVNFDGVFVNGPPAAPNGTGVSLFGSIAHNEISVAYNFVNCSFNCCGTGILYGPFVQGVSVANTNFTDNNLGIWAPPSEGGAIGQLLVVSSQFGLDTPSACAIKMETPIEAVSLCGNLFINGSTSGVAIQATAYARVQIVGNEFIAPGAGTGIAVGGTLLDTAPGFVIANNTFDNFTTGITVAAGAKGLIISENPFRNVVTAIVNSSTDTSNIIINNPGYNPVGLSSPTPTATNWAYTAGPSPETLYISDTTGISSITFGAVQMLPTSIVANAVFTLELGPNDPVLITHGGTMTAKRMIH